MSLKDDVTAAIRRVFQLGQTYLQQADSESYRENAKSDATLERYRALCVETAEIAARADARIAELELECSQWRDELRIYREAENARIAELEQAVAIRDTEIARLETDLELARIECAGLERRVKSLDESLHALVEVSEDSTIALARAALNGDDDDEETGARAGNGGVA